MTMRQASEIQAPPGEDLQFQQRGYTPTRILEANSLFSYTYSNGIGVKYS